MPDVTPLLPGDPPQIAGYRMLGRLGAGGQGVVYLAADRAGHRVAVKRLQSGFGDERARQQFVKEVSAARSVAPFCTARVLDFELDGPSPYVVSEFIDGPSLQQQVQAEGPIAGGRLHWLAIGTVTALAAIHQAGIVHRDFKPANVMLAADGPRVIDFGIARDLSTELTVTGRVFGTPAYMAPEQLRGEPVSPATDMFAWASVMAYAATGRVPFDAPNVMAIVAKISAGQPDLSGVPSDLTAVLQHCLAPAAAARPSAQQALALLLGRPAPSQDLADPTRVLADAATQVAAAVPPASVPPAAFPPAAFPPAAFPPAAGGAAAGYAAPPPTERYPAATPTDQPFWTHPSGHPEMGGHAGAAGHGTGYYGGQGGPGGPGPAQAQPWAQPGGPGGGGAGGNRATLWIVAAAVAVVLVAGGIWVLGQRENDGDPGAIASPTAQPTSGPAATTVKVTPRPTRTTRTTTAAPTTTAPQSPVVPDSFDGTWEGEVSQPAGSVQDFTVRIKLRAGDPDGEVELRDGVECSGPLTLTRASDMFVGGRLVIDDDPDGACAAAGTVALTRVGDDSLSFFWTDASNVVNQATGTLTRN